MHIPVVTGQHLEQRSKSDPDLVADVVDEIVGAFADPIRRQFSGGTARSEA